MLDATQTRHASHKKNMWAKQTCTTLYQAAWFIGITCDLKATDDSSPGVYPNVWGGFCQPNDAFHAIQEAQAAELSQNHRQNGVEVVCQQVMPHTLACNPATALFGL